MKAESLIAGRLRFKKEMAVIATAISFFVMIIAVAVSGGFSHEIRKGISAVTGDVILTNAYFNYYGGKNPIKTTQSYLPAIKSVKGVDDIQPAIYRVGIVSQGDDIQGLIFKGTAADTASLGVRLPSKTAGQLGLKMGDSMLTYFVSDKVKVRIFKVTDIYDSPIDTKEGTVAFVSISDLQRINGWSDDEASVLEIKLDDAVGSRKAIKSKSDEIGTLAYMSATGEDDQLIAEASVDIYSQLFDWLELIDLNTLIIIILMTVVAGFNMISGLLIILFRNISTIGTLKSLGMTDRSIAGVFLRMSARIVAIGMLIGNAAAFLFCLVQGTTHLLKLNPENYFVSFVPVDIDIPQVLLADAAAFAVIMFLLLIPSLFISRIDPSLTVKTE